MKFLIVGMGSIGRRHFRNLRSLGFSDVALARRGPEVDAPQKEFLASFRPRVFYDLAQGLADRPDAVIVANPTSMHAATARRALRAGTNVFVEKPLSHARSGLASLIAEAAARKKIIFVGYHFRNHPHLRRVKRMLDSGVLGDALSARFVTAEHLALWHPWEDYRRSYSGRRDLGGGVVFTQSHDLDIAYWLFGKPKNVFASIRNTGTLGIGAADAADLMVSFERCPAASFHLDYLDRRPVKTCVILGTKGKIEWDYRAGTLAISLWGGRSAVVRLPDDFDPNQMYIDEMKEFIRCIRKGTSPERDARAGQAVLEICLRAEQASKTHRPVAIP